MTLGGDLWLVAGGNAEAERHANYLLSARTAAAGPMAFVLAAADPDEYQHREALMAERLDEAVSAAVGSDTGRLLDVRMALLTEMNADFQTVHQARVEAAREQAARMAARREAEQRVAARVAAINEGVAKLAYGNCPYCGQPGCSPNCPGPDGGSTVCPSCGGGAKVHNGKVQCNDPEGCGYGWDGKGYFDDSHNASRRTAIWDGFWSAIHEQYEALKSAKSADDVMRICKAIPGTSTGEGFFEGSGGDEQVLDALLIAGWKPVRIDADYYWCLQAPNGDLVTYIEGDLERGNQMSTSASRRLMARRVTAAEIAIPEGTRPLNPEETISQIGRMNLLSISGGRVTRITKGNEVYGLALPVSQGYNAVVFLDANDTYIVQRTFRGKVMGEVRDVYFDQLGEQMYQAGMYQSNEFGGHVKGGSKTAGQGWQYQDNFGWYLTPSDTDGRTWVKIEPNSRGSNGGATLTTYEMARNPEYDADKVLTREYFDSVEEAKAACQWGKTAAKTAAWDDDEFDDEEYPECPACGGPGVELGTLGRLTHFRCQNCGWEWSENYADDGRYPQADDLSFESAWTRTRQPIEVEGSVRDVTSWSATQGQRDLTVVAANGGFTWAVFAPGQATPNRTGRAATLEAAQQAACNEEF